MLSDASLARCYNLWANLSGFAIFLSDPHTHLPRPLKVIQTPLARVVNCPARQLKPKDTPNTMHPSEHSTDRSATLYERVRRASLKVLRRVLHLWVSSTHVPETLDEWGVDPKAPIFYVLDVYALSSALIVDEALAKRGLKLASDKFEAAGVVCPRSFGANRRYQGLLFRTLKRQRHSSQLKAMIEGVEPSRLQGDQDIQVVPVSVLIGRAPDQSSGILKVLFSENWSTGGRLRRLIGTWVHGRHTLVQFGQPLKLSSLFAETQSRDKALARISRFSRVYFKRVRSSAIGPDRSHLNTLIDQLVRSEPIGQAIEAKARRDKISEDKARRLAYGYAREIAANYSYTFVMVANKVLTWFLYRIFRGVEVKHFKSFRQLAPGYEVVYVPCHRSHIDYLLLSYILYHRGLMPPHVAAGVNLNLPFVGSLIRRGGGFFLRRSFRSKPLYAAVFNQYVSMILSKGVALEYFIEGGRSRTGRLLPAKAGMLSMTVRAFLQQQQRPVLFQPVSIAYERLAEGDAYLAELSGQQKKPESLSDFKNVLNIVRKNYGEVTVSFGEPLMLSELLDAHAPDWKSHEYQPDSRPEWMNNLVDDLANQILVNINKASHANPVALISVALLASPRQALDENDLKALLTVLQQLLQAPIYSDRITVSEQSADEMIAYGIELGIIQRHRHEGGAIIKTDEQTAVLLSYFKNNLAHVIALSAWLACCYLNLRRLKRARLHELTQRVYPFFQKELFLPWSDQALGPAVDETIDAMVKLGLLSEQGNQLVREPGGETSSHHLKMLAHSMRQTLERYFIVVAVLSKNGPAALTKQQLEKLCAQCAARVAALHPLVTPEFHDRTLFGQFIATLFDRSLLRRNDEGLLDFGQALDDLNRDARLVLDREIHYTIVQSAPLLSELASADSAASKQT